MEKKITIFDHANKSLVYDTISETKENDYQYKVLEFDTVEQAEKWKDDFLAAGNYPDRPHTVLEILIPHK